MDVIARKTTEDLAKCDEFNTTNDFKQIPYSDDDDSLMDWQEVQEETSNLVTYPREAKGRANSWTFFTILSLHSNDPQISRNRK